MPLSKRRKNLRAAARKAAEAAYETSRETREVRASSVDLRTWRIEPDDTGAAYFTLTLVPPLNERTTWSVTAFGRGPTVLVRRDLSEETARRVYTAINDQTQIRTLRNNHGFREE